MIIECKKCRTKYRVDAAKIKTTGIRVRCSRCMHEFILSTSLKNRGDLFKEIFSGRKISDEASSFRQLILAQIKLAK
ncbi:MAG: hypothetical protein DRG50_06725 [Deltaproteobacteria bacterium]|nr:MAG: hypothetical protein DRG50_06725 [Deltaproteobacteria bacterium]